MRPDRASGGFTLLELMAVFALIAMVLAVAAPRLLPMATYFGHEGAARELAAFGESAMQYAKLNNEEVFVAIDLDSGGYWVEHWTSEDPDAKREESGVAALQETVLSVMQNPDATEEDLLEGAREVQNHFAGFAEKRLRARAELVEPNRKRQEDARGSMRASWSDDPRDQRMKKESFEAPMLERRRLPDGVYFESVTLPDETTGDGVVEVVISPLGLERDVQIEVASDDGDVATVRWDPITGRGFVYAGEVDR